MTRFLMALVGAVLAVASMQVSAKAATIPLGDIAPGGSATGYGGVIPSQPFADDVTFHLTAGATISGNLLNIPVTVAIPGGGSIVGFDISGLAATFLGNPLVLDPSGNFTYAGILAAGDYLIHVTGTAVGVIGGTYQLTVVAATPIPGALLLFMTAIGGMAGFAGLRRQGLFARGSVAA